MTRVKEWRVPRRAFLLFACVLVVLCVDRSLSSPVGWSLQDLLRQSGGACSELSNQVCMDECVPYDEGATPISCGDWFQSAKCCNNTNEPPEELPSGLYWQCYCEDDGITGAGIAVIVCSIIGGLGIIAAIVAFIWFRKDRARKRAKEEFNIAVQEALEYLPR